MKLEKKHKKKLINGCKGAIALFLAVLMTPFLSIAMLLVETGRYNSAVSVLDEAMGVSSTALLSSYDEYIKERWGLLALDQGLDIDTQYTNYLNTNVNVLGDSIQLNSVTAKGDFALNDSEILYNQIMEYSTLNAPTKLATNFLNLSDLIKKLESFANIGQFFDIIGSGAGAVDSTITLAESADDLKGISNELDDLKTQYSNDYTSFKTSVDNLTSALAEERPTDEDEAKRYDKNISELRGKVDKAQKTYKDTLDDIADKLQDFKDLMKSCNNAIESIKTEIASAANAALQLANDRKAKQDQLKEINKKISDMEANGQNSSAPALYTQALEQKTELENQIAEIAVQEGMASAAQNGLSNVSDGWKQSFNAYSDATIGELIKSFKNLSTKVNNFSSASVVETTVINDEDYYYLTISGYISAADIDSYLEAQATEMESGSLSALIDGIVSFFNSLLKLQLFYDPSLSAYIDVNYYNETFGGLPGGDSAGGGVMAIMTDIGNMMTAATEFSKDIVTLKWLDTLKELKNFIDSVVSLGKDLVQFAIDICNNIKDLFTSYDRLYYTTYTTFNLPCRTDFTSGVSSFTAMTGYKLTSASLPQKQQSSNLTLVDDLVVLIDQIKSASQGTGSDYTFCGAELEYVLFGSNSEVANQMYTFVSLYLVRLLLDIPAVLCNAEVQSLAASSTLAYPVVMILEILVEPFVDTVLLVNGASIDLYKTQIYLTPTGLPKLLQELTPLLKGMSEADKNSLGTEVAGAFGIAKDDYNYQQTLQKYSGSTSTAKSPDLFKFNYREYCFLILLLTVTKEQQMARLSNLIQMETLNYYRNMGVSYTFNMSNAYTFVVAETNVSVKQMLPSLADSSLFTVTRKQYRGY